MRKRRRWGLLLVPAALVFLIVSILRTRVDPLVRELAVAMVEDAASNLIIEAVDKELEQEDIRYNDLVELQYQDNRVVALTTDMQTVNRLKTQLLKDLDREIVTLNDAEMSIPLGNLSGIQLLSGQGSRLPVKVLSVASSDAQFNGAFYDAGINQTIHRIVMTVSLDLVILLPAGTVMDRVSTDVCVAETVLLGPVPDSYTYFNGTADEGLYLRTE